MIFSCNLIENNFTFLSTYADGPLRRAVAPPDATGLPPSYQPDEYLSSKEWLARYGIRARKLDFFFFLKHLIFKHAEGVIEKCYAPITPRTPVIKSLEELELNKDEIEDDKTVAFFLWDFPFFDIISSLLLIYNEISRFFPFSLSQVSTLFFSPQIALIRAV